LKDKIIVITGCTSGIGYQLTKQLQKENELIVIGRNEQKLKALEVEFLGLRTYCADLSQHNQIEEVGRAIAKDYEHIDLLINNAAVQHEECLQDSAFQYTTIREEITVNFTAVCSLVYLLLPCLLHDKEAAILNINSALSLTPKTSSAIYCGTKGALNIFSQSLRYQLDRSNIKVLQAFLELVDTSMTQGRGKNKISAKEAALKIIQGVEQGVEDNYFGKVKLLRLLLRIAPSLARKIMKKY